MDKTEHLESEIREYFQVERITDYGSFLIHTPITVDGEPFDLYLLHEGDNKYLLTDFGRFFKGYLSDEERKYYRKSAQKVGLEIIGSEITKTVDDPKDILESIFEVLDWCCSEKLRNLEKRRKTDTSKDEQITNAFVKITGLCVAIIFSLLVVGFVTVLCTLFKVIGGLF